MGRAAATELMHIVAQLLTTALLAALAAWAVPQATADIWWTALAAMALVAFMGIRPLRLALAADRAGRSG